MIVGIIVEGFYFSRGAYLKSTMNYLDIVCIPSFWISFGLLQNNRPEFTFFAAIAAARPIRITTFVPGTKVLFYLQFIDLFFIFIFIF